MQQPVQIDLSKTTGVKCQCGGFFFDQSIVIRKISRFVTGSPEDQMTLVPIFVCRSCGEPLKEFFPAGLSDIENVLGWSKVQTLNVINDEQSKFKLYQ